MYHVSSKTVVLTDSSKIGAKAAVPIIPTNMISTIITDEGVNLDMVEQFRAQGVEVMIVKK